MEEVVKYIWEAPYIKQSINSSGYITKFVIIDVNNNADLPPYKNKSAYNPEAGLDEQSTLLNLKQQFQELPPDIPGRKYKGQKYPKTGTPLSEVNKKEVIKDFPEPLSDTPTPYSYSGIIVDKDNNEPLSEVKIKDNKGNKTTSNYEGEFYIYGEYIPKKSLKLTFKLKKYSKESLIITTEKGEIIDDKIIQLESNRKAIEENKLKAKEFSQEQIQKIKDFSVKDFIKSQFWTIMNQIETLLVPYILNLLLEFGISKLEEVAEKKFGDMGATCPADIKGLNKIIDKKNKLTKQLNNIYKTIEGIVNFLKIPEEIISAGEKSIPEAQIAVNIPSFIPSTVATPNPVGPILAAKDGIKLLKDLIKLTKSKLGAGTFQLDFLLGEMQNVLNLLNILDTLIQGCAQEIANETPSEDGIGGASDSELLIQDQVSQELLDSTQDQSQQLSPVVTNVNGFDIDVETEITDNPLKRRRATAKNTEGVIVLRGEYSYSSNNQILIDELVFYIHQNDLKAE